MVTKDHLRYGVALAAPPVCQGFVIFFLMQTYIPPKSLNTLIIITSAVSIRSSPLLDSSCSHLCNPPTPRISFAEYYVLLCCISTPTGFEIFFFLQFPFWFYAEVLMFCFVLFCSFLPRGLCSEEIGHLSAEQTQYISADTTGLGITMQRRKTATQEALIYSSSEIHQGICEFFLG